MLYFYQIEFCPSHFISSYSYRIFLFLICPNFCCQPSSESVYIFRTTKFVVLASLGQKFSTCSCEVFFVRGIRTLRFVTKLIQVVHFSAKSATSIFTCDHWEIFVSGLRFAMPGWLKRKEFVYGFQKHPLKSLFSREEIRHIFKIIVLLSLSILPLPAVVIFFPVPCLFYFRIALSEELFMTICRSVINI